MMFFDDEFEELGLSIIAIVALALAYFAPSFIASQLGLSAELDSLVAWAKEQPVWALVPLAVFYFLAGFFTVLAALAAIYAVCYLVVKGICEASFWVIYSVRALTVWLIKSIGRLFIALLWLVTWPTRTLFEFVWHGISGLGARLDRAVGQARELRRVYREEYRDQFRSFREFKAAFNAANGQGRSKQKAKARQRRDDGRQEPPRQTPDPLMQALKLFGLGANCTQAELIRRYRELMRSAHPDAGGSNERASAINAAYTQIKLRKGWT